MGVDAKEDRREEVMDLDGDSCNDADSPPLWNCGCGLLVDGDWHCPSCGACPPWGCDIDHHGNYDAEEEYDFEEGIP